MNREFYICEVADETEKMDPGPPALTTRFQRLKALAIETQNFTDQFPSALQFLLPLYFTVTTTS